MCAVQWARLAVARRGCGSAVGTTARRTSDPSPLRSSRPCSSATDGAGGRICDGATTARDGAWVAPGASPLAAWISVATQPHTATRISVATWLPTAARRRARARTAVVAVREGMASSTVVGRAWCRDLDGSDRICDERHGRPDPRRSDAGQGRRVGCGRRFTVSQVGALLFCASSVVRRSAPRCLCP